MKKSLAVLVGAALALAACSPSTPAGTTSAEEPPAPTTTTPPPPPIWPLTGEEMSDPSLEGVNPVVGIKVENTSAARPWTGLSSADLVFVEEVEAGITRFHAVYNSEFPEVVGPVRSVRPMDAAILGMWDGTLLASGGQPQFLDRVASVVGLMTQDRGDAGFYRDRSRKAPHNVYVDLTQVTPQLTAPDEIAPIAVYGEPTSTANGNPGTALQVNYPAARTTWAFDAASGLYFRADNGTSSVQADGSQLNARNVLVLRVTTKMTGALDPVGNPVPETILSGSGVLYLFQGGKVVEGKWSKGGDKDPFVLTDLAGAPLVLTPGNTWLELLPERGVASWDPVPEPSPSASPSP